MSGIIHPNDWAWIDSITGWMTEWECQWLALMASTVCSWTEIGTFNGRSTMAVGLGLRKYSRLQLVDCCFGPLFKNNYKILKQRRPDLNIIRAECNSDYAAKYLYNTEVVFLDGDHYYPSILNDIKIWRHKCVTLCGHDYDPVLEPGGHAGVVLAVDEYFGDNKDIVCDSIWWARNL